MVCPKCAAFVDDDAKFCTVCGFPLGAQTINKNADGQSENQFKLVEQNNLQNKQSLEGPTPDLFNPPSDNARYTASYPTANTAAQGAVPVGNNDVYRVSPGRQAAPPVQAAAVKTKRKGNSGKIIAFVSVALVVAAAAAFAVWYFAFTVSPAEYMQNSDNGKIVSGFDGAASQCDGFESSVYDTFALYKALGGETFGADSESEFLELNVDDLKSTYDYSKSEINDFFEMYTKLRENIDVKSADLSGIQNGDKIDFDIYVNTSKINSLGFKKKLFGKAQLTCTVTVKTLSPAAELNPFDVICEVVYDKSDSTIKTIYNEDFKKESDYLLLSYENKSIIVKDKDSGETIGKIEVTVKQEGSTDKLTEVSASIAQSEEECLSLGIKITESSKTFQVFDCDYITNGTDFNINDFNDLSDTALEKIQTVHPDANLKDSAFGYKGSGFNNIVVFVFSYTDSSTSAVKYASVVFYDVKIDESDRTVVSPSELKSDVTDLMSSVDDIFKLYKNGCSDFYRVKTKTSDSSN